MLSKVTYNVLQLGDEANFVTGCFPLKINSPAKDKREFTAYFAIAFKPMLALRLFIYKQILIFKTK